MKSSSTEERKREKNRLKRKYGNKKRKEKIGNESVHQDVLICSTGTGEAYKSLHEQECIENYSTEQTLSLFAETNQKLR